MISLHVDRQAVTGSHSKKNVFNISAILECLAINGKTNVHIFRLFVWQLFSSYHTMHVQIIILMYFHTGLENELSAELHF